MSNFPHSAALSSSLSTSPFGKSCDLQVELIADWPAVQTNLETLINRARNNPLSGAARRLSDATDVDHPSGSNARFYEGGYVAGGLGHGGHRPNTIREVSYDEGAIFLEDDEEDRANERSGLLSQPQSRRQSQNRGRRTSYGTTSEPLKDPSLRGGHRGSLSMSSAQAQGEGRKAGNSRSRSKVRSPPRKSRGDEDGPSSETHDDRRSIKSHRSNRSNATATGRHGQGQGSGGYRGRDVEERPLSPIMALTKARRESVASWFNGDDSSGDDGGDLARGLLQSGGGPMLGAGHGLGGSGMASAGMDFDPAEELTYDELELPVNEQGLEVRVWSDAMRVSQLIKS
jgi:MATE family multidrug resistance protein